MKTSNLGYLTIIFIGGYIVFLGFFSSLDYNVNTPNHTIKLLFNLSLPEGWGFFTKSPREDMVDIYSIEDNKLKKRLTKNGDPKNLFGISRMSRKIGMEASIIAGQLKDSMWLSQTDLVNINIPTQEHIVGAENLHYLEQGNYVLVKRKTVPWAWRKNVNKKDIPYEISHVKLLEAN